MASDYPIVTYAGTAQGVYLQRAVVLGRSREHAADDLASDRSRRSIPGRSAGLESVLRCVEADHYQRQDLAGRPGYFHLTGIAVWIQFG